MTEKMSEFRAFVLALFVLLAGSAGVYGLFAVGSHEWLFAESFELRAEFASISGIHPGTRVRIQGLDAGLVARIAPPAEPGQPVTLHLRMDASLKSLIRRDAVASLASQGIVGARVIEIHPGSSAAEVAQPGELLATERPIELNEVLAKAYQSGLELGEAGQELRAMGKKMDSILTRIDIVAAKVEQGEGTLGKLVMSDDAHRAALELMTSGDQMMTHLDESLTALRRVWPLRDHFIQQGMNDPDDLLFRPNSKREIRTYLTSQLFEPERSVLTGAGRKKLDDAANWLRPFMAEPCEVLVAAFNADEENSLRGQRLTQEQANAVYDYLVNVQTANRYGWFGRRKMEAAGFANRLPEATNPQQPPGPRQRIEIIVFVPGR